MKSTTCYSIFCVLIASYASVHAIGERMLDINGLFGMIRGFSDIFDDVNTTDVESHKMMGQWHQMYRAAINFDVFRTNMYCQVSYYKPNLVMGPDGFTIDEAYHVVSKVGDIEVYRKDASKTGPGQYWIHPHDYFYPHQFYVMKLGPEVNESYQYVVASDGNKLALTILARDPAEYYQKYDAEVLEFLSENRIGGASFWNLPSAIYQGPDCYYPSEREIFARRVLAEHLKKANPGGGRVNPSQLFGAQAGFGGGTAGLSGTGGNFGVARQPQPVQNNPLQLFSDVIGQGLGGRKR